MIEDIERDDHALKPFFDVVLYDAEDRPLSWTKGLVQSINYPSFSFTVSEQNAGTERGYQGWTLPDALSISMFETRDRDLERYLLEWAFGEKGIFDLDAGGFRAVDKESYLYRQLMFRTTTYNVSIQGTVDHAAIDITNAVEMTLRTAIDTFSGGKLTLQTEDYIAEIAKEFSSAILRENTTPQDKNFETLIQQEHGKEKERIQLYEKQQVPILDKIVKLGEMTVNQFTTKIPLARTILTPVVLPPPLMQIPIGWNLKFNAKSIVSKILDFSGKTILKKTNGSFGNNTRIFSSRVNGGVKEFRVASDLALQTAQKARRQIMDSSIAAQAFRDCAKKVDNILKELPKATAEEISTSTSMYKVALQSYQIDNYSYDTGGAVSITLNLPLVDYKKPELMECYH